MKIYKFYGKLNVDIQPPFTTWIKNWHFLPIIFFDNQQVMKYLGIDNKEYFLRMDNVIIENFNDDFSNLDCVEILFDAESGRETIIRGVARDSIRHEALKDATDMNESVYFEINHDKSEKEKMHVISKDDIQGIIDRIILYGDSFKDNLEKLCNEYPINVEYVKYEDNDYANSMRRATIKE